MIWSHSLSVLLFSLSLWLSGQFQVELTSIQPAIIIGLSLIGLFYFCIKNRVGAHFLLKFNAYLSSPLPYIICLVAVYLSIVGVYDLVPSDTLRHMERIQAAIRDISDVTKSDFSFFNNISGHYHYYFYAYLMHFSDINVNSMFWVVSLLNSSLLLLALYEFAIYQGVKGSIKIPHILNRFNVPIVFVILSLILFVLTKGIASFSFVRYYSLAPTLLSFSVFLILVIKIDQCFRYENTKKDFLLIFLGLSMLLFWHLQELLFVVVFSVLLTFYYCVYHFCNNASKSVYGFNKTIQFPFRVIIILTSSILLIWGVIHFQMSVISGVTNRLISLSGLLKFITPADFEFSMFFSHIKLLNPFNQFSQVLGLWGIAVYFCSLFHLKVIAQKPLLLCGLIIPFVTVFNPFFVDVFLRLRGEDTLYRLLYAIPLSTVGAFILVHSVCLIFESTKGVRGNMDKLQPKVIPLLCISILAVGLIPFSSFTLLTQYNRINDIFPVETEQSLRYWLDLSEEIQKLSKQNNVLTDPVTGYIITATTKSISRRYKFTKAQHVDLNNLDFSSHERKPFSAYRGNYLVINLRDGSFSERGLLSTHWPVNVLKISDYYSKELLNYVDENSQLFDKTWEHDQVRVYRIR